MKQIKISQMDVAKEMMRILNLKRVEVGLYKDYIDFYFDNTPETKAAQELAKKKCNRTK